ncbi:MAG: hypothetical protein CMF46_04475 [Legionellales bacterium]|nr:hypothetical protein [Legionellales bacterium]|tara:strand:+ start:437 stop:1429 length:993 start_codon:yes stop_codon:yes gene_type:complete
MQFKLPDLGEGLGHVTIIKWHVACNEVVQVDQVIVSVETAKAVVDIPSPYAGTIKKIHANIGDELAINEPLVSYDRSQSDVIKAIPGARKLAKEMNIDLTLIVPEKGDTIRVSDVKKHIEKTNSPAVQHNVGMFTAMSHAQQQVALATVMNDAILNQIPKDITSTVIQAMQQAQSQYPLTSAIYHHSEKKLVTQKELLVGLVVDTNDDNQSFVPCINPANQTIESLRDDINRYKEKSSTKQFSQQDFPQANILLSNYGSLGGRYATPLVNPPCLVTVGVGQVYNQLTLNEQQQLTQCYHLPISISFDHRYLTGAYVISYLKILIEYIQCQ